MMFLIYSTFATPHFLFSCSKLQYFYAKCSSPSNCEASLVAADTKEAFDTFWEELWSIALALIDLLCSCYSRWALSACFLFSSTAFRACRI